MDSDNINFSNRELLSKWNWVANWIERLFHCVQTNETLITDRCPLEAVPYATAGNLLLDAILHTFKELEHYDIRVRTIYLRMPFEVCFQRAQKRLETEPVRKRYGEDDLEYSMNIYDFYERNIGKLWDFTVEVQTLSVDDISDLILRLIEKA